MAETLLSPGVLARENDSSQVSQGPITVGAAIIGPAVKGPVEIPTTVTSYSQYKSIFGGTVESGSDSYNYLTGISVYNYFQNGGESVLVTRVTSGSFSSAESTLVSNNITTASNSFTLETLSEGDIMNNSGSESQGALTLGTKDNIRWEIASVNTSSGQFSLLVRRGDDNNRDKKILETWTNLSLDPKAENYIESVIGNSKKSVMTDGGTTYIQDQGTFRNKSSFIRVKSVHTKTPDYFDNNGIAKTAYTASLPIVGSGSFASAVGSLFNSATAANFYENVATADIQGLTAADYTTAVSLMANKDEYQFNSITTPGVTSQNGASIVSSVANNSVNRGDSIAIVDLVNYQANVGTVTTQAAAFDSSYATAYWPWCQTIDPETGKQVWVPASVMIPGVYAYTDASADAWFAPAGLTRGALGTVIRAERKLPSSTRDTLYEANVNPIATFPNSGVVVFGQKTLQKRASALDRVNVRRLLIAVKTYVSQIADTLVFEQNSASTRNNFLTQVNPYLESVQQRQGLYAFKTVMDESNNGPDVVDRNQLVGQIFLQPTKTAEFVLLDFNVTPTGATFE
jgi:phage tail sheath protein FI